MSVTGDEWQSINLGQMFPELDPNNPGSFASLARDKINQSTTDLNSTIGAINNSLYKAADLINHVRVASNAIKAAQLSLEDLINNTANMGVYSHFLGICPDFPKSLLKGNSDVISKVSQIMRDKTDKCTPEFVGDTAYVGGFIMLVGAPNPVALWEKLKVIAEIFPALKAVVKDGQQRLEATVASVAQLTNFFADSANRFDSARAEFAQFQKANTAQSQPLIFEGCDKWICGTLKDLIPAFDPNLAGSPLNVAMGFEKELVDNVTSSMDTIAGFANTLNNLVNSLQKLQNDITSFKNQVLDFGEKLAATGVYFHAIGRDLTITNSEMFIDAVSQSMNDASDPGKPNFRGNTACMAGLLFVVGAPNPAGLQKKISNVGKVFRAFGDKYDDLNSSLSVIKENAEQFREGVSISSVPQLSIVNGQIVATTASLSFEVTDPTVATATDDGSGTPPGQVTPIEGETQVPNAAPIQPGVDSTCLPDNNGTPSLEDQKVRKTTEIGETVREARRRVSDIARL